ncbi:MAG: hypothetical protein KAF40_01465, partial [Flavihumibacter sp.]|nr:hypothetical protein [Flavihumibacter sp.]
IVLLKSPRQLIGAFSFSKPTYPFTYFWIKSRRTWETEVFSLFAFLLALVLKEGANSNVILDFAVLVSLAMALVYDDEKFLKYPRCGNTRVKPYPMK